MTEALEAFAENTMRYLREEGRLLAEGIGFPPLETRFRDRHALVVARGPGHKRDLRIVRPYVRDFQPVLVAVDGGADALLEAGYKPDVIVGDMDSVSDRALGSGAEILVHAYENGDAPGAERSSGSGSPPRRPGAGDQRGPRASPRLREGRRADRRRRHPLQPDRVPRAQPLGMSSTFLTRLKVGEILVDAKGVSRLVSRQVGVWPLVLVAAAGLGALVVAVAVSPQLRFALEELGLRLRDLLGF